MVLWCLGLGLGFVSYGRFSRGLSNLDDSPIFFWAERITLQIIYDRESYFNFDVLLVGF